jgi:type IV pilus assembly protein PilW
MQILYNKKHGLSAQAGFSIIELMISIPLGLLVLAAVLKIFTASMEGVHLQNGFSRVQENGRIATELMVRDIRGADYWGCGGNVGEITNHLDTTDTSYDESILPTSGKGIDGDNDVTSETISGITVKDVTDILTLRGASSLSGVQIETPYMPLNSATIHINKNTTIVEGDILLLSDCKEADLFSNTQNNTGTSGQINHTTGNSLGAQFINNVTKDLSHSYGGDAQILIPYAKVYFIGVNTSGSHSLYRADDGVANELVRGVNDLQIMYGVDTSGNGSANTFKAAPTTAEMDQVLSIRVSLTTESGESSSGTPLERTYQTTANIRNRTL